MNFLKKILNHLKKPAIVALMILLLFSSFAADYRPTSAATFTWNQATWAGGADAVTTASHASNQTGWSKYYSASTTISAGTGISLSGQSNLLSETTDADFNAGDKTDHIYVGSDTVYPQKPNTYTCESNNDNFCQSGRCDTTCQTKLADGQSCDEASDCTSGQCQGSICVTPCSASTNCGTSCFHNGLTYGTVTANSQCWLDRNLGATAVATAYNSPTTSYGDLYQWGRLTDGHQIRTSGTQTGLSSSDTPGHSNFIYGMGSPYDWRSPQNNNLWQGVSGTNNPCPTGWRVPTQPEWASVVSALGITNYTTAASSVLKLPAAGLRDYNDAALNNVGSLGLYWSSTVNGTNAYNLHFYSDGVNPALNFLRAIGFSVRCVKN